MNSVLSTNGNGNGISKHLIYPPSIELSEAVSAQTHGGPPLSGERSLVIIDVRALDRECLAQCIAAHKLDMRVVAFGSMEEWRRSWQDYPPLAAILLNIGGRTIYENAVAEEIAILSSEFAAPIIVLADTDDLGQIMKALECGAKGYIPSSVNIEVCIEAIALSLAGGIFVPASSVFAMRQVLNTGGTGARPSLSGMFTARQAEVAEALRRGKANKIIAYELNLRESTVKVHIRNIMKKVKATNRTEVAYKINDLFPADGTTKPGH